MRWQGVPGMTWGFGSCAVACPPAVRWARRRLARPVDTRPRGTESRPLHVSPVLYPPDNGRRLARAYANSLFREALLVGAELCPGLAPPPSSLNHQQARGAAGAPGDCAVDSGSGCWPRQRASSPSDALCTHTHPQTRAHTRPHAQVLEWIDGNLPPELPSAYGLHDNAALLSSKLWNLAYSSALGSIQARWKPWRCVVSGCR